GPRYLPTCNDEQEADDQADERAVQEDEGQPGRPRHLRRPRAGLHGLHRAGRRDQPGEERQSRGGPQSARGDQHAAGAAHHAVERRQVRREGPERRRARHPPAGAEGAVRDDLPLRAGRRRRRLPADALEGPEVARPHQAATVTAEVLLQGIVSSLLMGFVYALIAAGLSLIFGLMEIVNFAHGEFLMLAMFSTFWAWALWRLDPVVSLP